MLVLAVLADGQRALPGWRVRPFLRLRADKDRVRHRSVCDGGEAPARCSRSAACPVGVSGRLRLHDRRHGGLALVWRPGEGLAIRGGRIPANTGIRTCPALERRGRRAPPCAARGQGQLPLGGALRPAARTSRRRRFRTQDARQGYEYSQPLAISAVDVVHVLSLWMRVAMAWSMLIEPLRACAPRSGKSIQPALNPSIICIRGAGFFMPWARKIGSHRSRATTSARTGVPSTLANAAAKAFGETRGAASSSTTRLPSQPSCRSTG